MLTVKTPICILPIRGETRSFGFSTSHHVMTLHRSFNDDYHTIPSLKLYSGTAAQYSRWHTITTAMRYTFQVQSILAEDSQESGCPWDYRAAMAYGGLNTFHRCGRYIHAKMEMNKKFAENFLLFQFPFPEEGDVAPCHTDRDVDIAARAVELDDWLSFGNVFHNSKSVVHGMREYAIARVFGAMGGCLQDGIFILFVHPSKQSTLIQKMKDEFDLQHIPFSLSFQGSVVIHSGEVCGVSS